MHLPNFVNVYFTAFTRNVICCSILNCKTSVTIAVKININNFRSELSCPVILSDFLLNTGIRYENFAETIIHVQLYVLKTACKGLRVHIFCSSVTQAFCVDTKQINLCAARAEWRSHM